MWNLEFSREILTYICIRDGYGCQTYLFDKHCRSFGRKCHLFDGFLNRESSDLEEKEVFCANINSYNM